MLFRKELVNFADLHYWLFNEKQYVIMIKMSKFENSLNIKNFECKGEKLWMKINWK